MSALKELPLSFNGEMVRALLAGNKSMTRRLPKSNDAEKYQQGRRLWVREQLWISECGQYFARQLNKSLHEVDIFARDGSFVWLQDATKYTGFDDPRLKYPAHEHMVTSWSNLCRELRSGRIIQSFNSGFCDLDINTEIKPLTGNTVIRSYEAIFRKHLPVRYTPRFTSRILIEVTDSWREPLQDISEEDAIAEGVRPDHSLPYPDGDPGYCHDVAKRAFGRLWDSINGKREGASWSDNPTVTVVKFRVVSVNSNIHMSHTTQSEAILAVVRDHPGCTGAELYQFFDAETWDREKVLLAKLHKAGRVRREGEGRKKDPFRYWVVSE